MKKLIPIMAGLLCAAVMSTQAEDIIVDDFTTDTMTSQTRFRNSYVDTGWISKAGSEWTIAGGVLANAGTLTNSVPSEGGVGQVVSTAGLTAGNRQIAVSFDYTVAAGATLYYNLIGLTANVNPAGNEILGNTGTVGGNIQATKANVDYAAMDIITGGAVVNVSTLSLTGSGTYSATFNVTGYAWAAGEAVVGGNAITDVKDYEMIMAVFSSDLTTNGAAMTIDNYSVTATSPANSAVKIDPAALSLILVDPEPSTNGTIDVSIIFGSLSNDVEIVSTGSDVTDFTAVTSGTTLSSGNTNETITVTYTNPGDLVNNGDATNATLSVEWTAVGSGVTNMTEVPLDVVYSKFTLVGLATDRSMSTPNDRLRVAFQYGGADSVELAVLNAADTKLDFTAYDGHAASEVRAIYTTKPGVPSAVTNQATDFTESGFFSYIAEPFSVNIPVDNSGDASDVVELVNLVNTDWTWKDSVDETVVFIDLASISELSNLVSDVDLTIEVTAKSGASSLVSEIDVTITPDGTVSYSFVANGATFAETNGIEIGSNDGGSGNQFTGNNRHILSGPGADQDQVASAGGGLNDKIFGMFFDTDISGSFLLDNILINLSTDNAPVIPAGALLKLELWKINAVLGDLSTTNVATTFPDPELVFTGTGVFPGTYNDDDLYKIDLPNLTLDADTRYGWALRWNTTEPARLVIGVDQGPTTVEGSFDDGNHLRLNRSNDMFPFYGVTDGESAGAWDIVFHLRSGDPGTFEAWAISYGLFGADADKDADTIDQDGYENLMEYALGMDPTAEDAGSKESISTVAEGSTNYFEYVHARRADYVERSLTYSLIDTENLVFPTSSLATNSQDEVNVGAVVGSYETVTNRYIVDKTAQFIELEVQED